MVVRPRRSGSSRTGAERAGFGRKQQSRRSGLRHGADTDSVFFGLHGLHAEKTLLFPKVLLCGRYAVGTKPIGAVQSGT